MHLISITQSTVERNDMCVMFVTDDSLDLGILKHTCLYIYEKTRFSVTFVINGFLSVLFSIPIRQFTLGKNHTSVMYVVHGFHSDQVLWKPIKRSIQELNHMHVTHLARDFYYVVPSKNILLNTSVKPYVCCFSSKTYRNSRALNHHITCQTGEKPYACNDVGEQFQHQQALKKTL
jgi:hypothetical protein